MAARPRSPAADPAAQRPPAELAFAAKLAAPRRDDAAPRPLGWSMSLRAVKRFVLGGDGAPPKVVCPPALVERDGFAAAERRLSA